VRRAVAVLLLSAAACGGPPSPAALDTRNEMCAQCRMMVSDARYAAQIVRRGEEPRFFDDLGCLAAYLRQRPPAKGAAVFVADRRTKEWVPARSAVYARVPGLATPMASGIVAHAGAASRAADRPAAAGTALTAEEVFGSSGLPREEAR
jgi:copper chaperone NosL